MQKKETKKEAKAREILEKLAAKKAMIEKINAAVAATPIAKAVAPIKEDAIARAEKDAREYSAKLIKQIEEAGNDLNKVAPYPRSTNVSREQYRNAMNRHNLYVSITTARKDNVQRHWSDATTPYYVDACPAKIEVFVETAKITAAEQYDAFVHKLVKKVGETTEASLTGNHVWGYSVLHVTLPSGEKQKWQTQQIVNCSVYGLLFNQWPTRQIKN